MGRSLQTEQLSQLLPRTQPTRRTSLSVQTMRSKNRPVQTPPPLSVKPLLASPSPVSMPPSMGAKPFLARDFLISPPLASGQKVTHGSHSIVEGMPTTVPWPSIRLPHPLFHQLPMSS